MLCRSIQRSGSKPRGQRKAEQIRATRAQIVAVPCHNCMDQINDVTLHFKLGTSNRHICSLVEEALIMPPRKKEIFLESFNACCIKEIADWKDEFYYEHTEGTGPGLYWCSAPALPVSRPHWISAGSGYLVYLVEQSPVIGGNMPLLDKNLSHQRLFHVHFFPKAGECARHRSIKILTCTELQELRESPVGLRPSC